MHTPNLSAQNWFKSNRAWLFSKSHSFSHIYTHMSHIFQYPSIHVKIGKCDYRVKITLIENDLPPKLKRCCWWDLLLAKWKAKKNILSVALYVKHPSFHPLSRSLWLAVWVTGTTVSNYHQISTQPLSSAKARISGSILILIKLCKDHPIISNLILLASIIVVFPMRSGRNTAALPRAQATFLQNLSVARWLQVSLFIQQLVKNHKLSSAP